MPTSVDWHDPQETIIRTAFIGNWTIEDFIEALQQTKILAQTKPAGSVAVIIDVEKSSGLPRNANIIPHLRRGFQNMQYEQVIFAGGTSFGITLVRTVSRMIPESQRIIFFEDSLPNAEARIAQSRAASG